MKREFQFFFETFCYNDKFKSDIQIALKLLVSVLTQNSLYEKINGNCYDL